LESARLEQENIDLRQQTTGQYELLGRSGIMNNLREQARRYAEHSTTVLISGESGSGKGILARYIHSHSKRRDAPFIHVPASGLTSARSASELFGLERGEKLHFGSLEQANGGTIYLEDIIDMNLDVQARLLSAITQGSYLRVGGVDSVPLDMRIIAASSQDASEAVSSGRLREDLYYQLNVLPLEMPPLRDHREDISELVEHFVDQQVTHQNLPYRRFGVATQNRLRYYSWPGNVRELKNVIQRLLILGYDEEITIEEVEMALGAVVEASEKPTSPGFDLPLKAAREDFERRYLEQKIREENGNISKVAERVGLERTHLYRKFKSLNLDPKQVLASDD
jgi:two-component system nitrogen regulation response regulator NtrX